MNAEIAVFVSTQVLATVATVAAVKAQTADLEKRVDKVEKKVDDTITSLPRDYVPRTEVQLALSNIAETTKQTHAMIQALVYSGGNREAAQKGLR